MSAHQQLQRRLGTFDATAIGLGSMLGAGVFVVFAPAAALAGQLLALSVVIAGVVAYCNAVASAALAAKYPTSGGTYVYGREQLGQWPGFLAGWGFVTAAGCGLGFAAVGAALSVRSRKRDSSATTDQRHARRSSSKRPRLRSNQAEKSLK